MQNDIRPTRPAKPMAETEPTPEPETPETDTFETPETVAAQDDLISQAEPDKPAEEEPKQSWWHRFDLHWPPGKKEWALIVLVVLLLAGGGYALFSQQPEPVVYKKAAPKKVVKAATTVASQLTGVQVAPELNKRPVTGVMIENSSFSRPQAGLSEAGVVFEAIAEGGITRFLALFQETSPEVGPVRSARPYYLVWAQGFNATYAHVGGSPEALQNIKDWGVRDLDQFANAGAYRREASRPAPHNVYTNIPTLIELARSKGYTESKFTSLARKPEAKAKAPTATKIDMNISGANYNTHYDYDPATNSYARSMAGAPHVDANNNLQIKPKVVVALIMSYGIQADGKHSQYGTIGSGQAVIFQDGTVTTGTWSKADNNSQITFADASGKALKLNPGQTWFTALADAGRVTHAP